MMRLQLPIRALLGACICRTFLEWEISSWGNYVCGLRGKPLSTNLTWTPRPHQHPKPDCAVVHGHANCTGQPQFLACYYLSFPPRPFTCSGQLPDNLLQLVRLSASSRFGPTGESLKKLSTTRGRNEEAIFIMPLYPWHGPIRQGSTTEEGEAVRCATVPGKTALSWAAYIRRKFLQTKMAIVCF